MLKQIKTKQDYLREQKSCGSLKLINIPENCEKLAEFIGILLGDGNVHAFKKGKKIGTYMVRIAGHSTNDFEYLTHHVAGLFKDLFGLNPKTYMQKGCNSVVVLVHSRLLVDFLIQSGFKSGNKIKNQVSIPDWIIENDNYLRACLRGLIDTDGSIYRMSQKDPQLIRMNFKNFNMRLLHSTREAFIKLGFHPSKIICGNVFYISRQAEVVKYIKEIGFSNLKHKRRFQKLQHSPVV